ncbi:unnamed protein product [Staurois parvus]|uniref:Protein kinase domain-containing protein n=1 Tax=Staurois parvus TaxID=386267 RepID=A0ABN9CYB7_9NEOB|nr:unnamed protein product [Staurois parvus]
MEFLGGGDLEKFIRVSAPLDEETLRRLTAEILCGLQHLHSLQIVHRDLKPENILLDNAGHVKIADFGLSAMCVNECYRVTSWVGTPGYMAPEVYYQSPYYYPADYFSFGIIVYEMALGEHPYYTEQENEEQLVARMYTMPPYLPWYLDFYLHELLRRLLCLDQEQRAYEVCNLRSHPFFKGIDWEEIEEGPSHVQSTLEPILEQPLQEIIEVDTFLSKDLEMPIDSLDQEYFKDFTYISEGMKARQA